VLFDLGICVGTVAGAAAHLAKVHQFFETRFPNVEYPIRDKATRDAYVGTTLTIDPNVCLPAGLTVAALAAVVDRYSAAHPDRVAGARFPFTVSALADAYGCGPNRH